jgi:hypothetical protein
MPSGLFTDPAYAALVALRQDAVDRGLFDLALAYGWSAIARGDAIMVERFGPQQVSFAAMTAPLRRMV